MVNTTVSWATHPTQWDVSTETKEACKLWLPHFVEKVAKTGQHNWSITEKSVEPNSKGGFYCLVVYDRRGL